jgi:hypothetical protein
MQDNEADEGPALAKNRTVELLIAGVLLVGSAVVIIDSVRLGFGWREGEGPAPGYFPFWVAVLLGGASAINFVQALLGRSKGARDAFVSRPAFGRVLAVLIPAAVFVAAVGGVSLAGIEISGIGLYLASAMFITGFMTVFGLEGAVSRRLSWAAVAMFLAAIVTGLYLAALVQFGGITFKGFAIPYILPAALLLLFAPLPSLLDRLRRTIMVGPTVSLTLFCMFERWFLVALPKGPVEAYLGLG